MDKAPLQVLLKDGLKILDLELTAAQIESMLSYVDLLSKWCTAYNLTSVREPKEILVRHILDSLAVRKFLSQGPCLDIGTGAGLPGIPLAISVPEWKFSLLDSNSKKIRFVRQAVIELQLTNVELVQNRVENHRRVEDELGYFSILSRAFSSLKTLVEMCYPLKNPNGAIFAMKGKVSEQEVAELESLPFTLKSVEIESLEVPFLDEERHLVVIK